MRIAKFQNLLKYRLSQGATATTYTGIIDSLHAIIAGNIAIRKLYAKWVESPDSQQKMA